MNVTIKVGPENLLPWSNMEDWAENGTSAAPTEHTLSGASATVSRETTIVQEGTYSAKVTRVGADATLYYDLTTYANYLGRKITFGCWVYATVASRARLSISDGVSTPATSSYHSGGSSWEFLTVTLDIATTATRIRAEMQVNTGNTSGYFDGGILVEGPTSITVLTSIADIGQWVPADTYNSQEFRVTRRGGSKIPNVVLASKKIKIDGMIIGTTPTLARTSQDTLNQVINSLMTKSNNEKELRDLYLYDDRKIKVHLVDNKPENKVALRVFDFSLSFVAPEPYFISTNYIRVKQTISATPTTFTVTPSGNAFTRPIIKITNSSSNITSLTFENLTNGQTFSYVGSLSTGNSLIVDTDAFTVQNNGTDDIANFTGDLDTILLPGGNQIRITGLVSGTVRVDYLDRWY